MRPAVVDLLGARGWDFMAAAVPTRGAVVALGIAVAVILFVQRGRRVGLPPNLTVPLAAVAAVGLLIGARLYIVIETGVLGDPGLWVGNEGQGSWGGFIGAAAAAAVYLGIRRPGGWRALDAAAAPVMLGLVLARLGCFLDGCDFGSATSNAWAVSYPTGSPAFQAHLAEGLVSPAAVQSAAVHPLPVYLSLNALVLFLVLSAFWRCWRDVPGATFALLWASYGVTRFFLEFFRDPAAGGSAVGLSGLQWVSLAAAGFGFALGAAVLRKSRDDAVGPIATENSEA